MSQQKRNESPKTVGWNESALYVHTGVVVHYGDYRGGGDRRKIYTILIIQGHYKRRRSAKVYPFELKWTLRMRWWLQN